MRFIEDKDLAEIDLSNESSFNYVYKESYM